MNNKAFFPCGGGSDLILWTSSENQIFFLRTPMAVKFFTKLLKNDTLAQKRKSLCTQMDLYNPYVVPHTIP